MLLTFEFGLPFITLTVTQNGRSIRIPSALLDTGSASTILSIDLLSSIGIRPEPDDTIHQIRGIGGVEAVFRRKIDRIDLDTASVTDFVVEVGAMDYGFDIQGIIGTDFLHQTAAAIDFAISEIRFRGNA